MHHFTSKHLVYLQPLIKRAIVLLILLTGISFTRLYSYLLFHSLAELTSVVIAVSVFIIVWHSVPANEGGYLLILGIGSAFVAGIDVLHILAFPGMGVFFNNGTNLTAQLWLAGRYLQALIFLAAPLFLRRPLGRWLVLVVFATLSTLLLASIFAWDVFPVAYIESSGLTIFKITSEYVIIALLLVAAIWLSRRRNALDSSVYYRLMGAIAASIVSEFAFTLYFDPTDIANFLGHVFKIIAFFLLYRALVEVAFARPYSLLFRQLKQSEEAERDARVQVQNALRASEHKYRSLVENALTGVYQVNLEGTCLYANPELARLLGFDTPEELIGANGVKYFKNPQDYLRLLEILQRNKSVRNFETEAVTRCGEIRSVLLSAALEGQVLSGMVLDITEYKQAMDALRLSERKFSTLFQKAAFSILLVRMSDGVITDVNEAFEKAFGYSREEAIGKTLPELGFNFDEEVRARILSALKEHGSVRNQELTLRTKSGEPRIFLVNSALIEIDHQEYVICTMQDITERKQAEDKLETQLRRLATLREIDAAILGTTDLRLVLKTILQETKTRLEADIVQVELFNPHTLMLETVAVIGNQSQDLERVTLRLGEGVGGKAGLERHIIAIPNLSNSELSGNLISALAKEGVRAVYSAPLIAKGALLGVINVAFCSPFTASQEWLDFFEILAGQTALAVDSAKAFENLVRANLDLKAAYDATIEGWSRALDLRDKETEGHTLRVTEMTIKLARAAGMAEEELVHVRRGALLHDIGKMGVPDAILLKPEPLTDEEWAIMRQHPQFAYDMLSPIAYLRPALDIPWCHHEKWDGSGYPRGLKGEQIPLAARLFAVVDVWDALRSDRPYRQGWPKDKVIEHIQSLSGTHFDPKAVELFLNMMKEDEDLL